MGSLWRMHVEDMFLDLNFNLVLGIGPFYCLIARLITGLVLSCSCTDVMPWMGEFSEIFLPVFFFLGFLQELCSVSLSFENMSL